MFGQIFKLPFELIAFNRIDQFESSNHKIGGLDIDLIGKLIERKQDQKGFEGIYFFYGF